MDGFDDYMSRIRSAAKRHCMLEDGVFYGKDGAKRFARECGPALVDFSSDPRNIQDMISSTYSGICVIAYGLKPPINAGEWFKAMREGVENELARRHA